LQRAAGLREKHGREKRKRASKLRGSHSRRTVRRRVVVTLQNLVKSNTIRYLQHGKNLTKLTLHNHISSTKPKVVPAYFFHITLITAYIFGSPP
jgi:hypothetical protein